MLSFNPCNQTALEQDEQCAVGDTLSSYLHDIQVAFFDVKNYLDYQKVGVPVQSMADIFFSVELSD